MRLMGKEELEELTGMARESHRLRKNLNLHEDYDDPCQRLFNAVEPGSYIRPHRHSSPPKHEFFMVVRGALALVTFTDRGEPARIVRLDQDSQMFAVDLPPHTWHTVVSLSAGTVFFEAKQGPYVPLSDKDFAPWAPAEASGEAASYLEHLVTCIRSDNDSGNPDA